MNKNVIFVWYFLSFYDGEEVRFIIGLSTAKQNTFGNVLFMDAVKNTNIELILFVEDQIYFGQGDRGHFVSKVWSKWYEGKCI